MRLILGFVLACAIGAVCRLLVFLVPATLMAHAFWQVADTALYPVQLINFFKNVCMTGGLVLIAAQKTNISAPTLNAVDSYAYGTSGFAGS